MLRICYLYPDLLNIHGNWGNMAAILKRCAWRGIEVELVAVNLGESTDFEKVDIVYLGMGSDKERDMVLENLRPMGENLKKAIEQGLTLLAIGSGYQLLGMYRLNEEGHRMPYLGLINFYTRITSTYLVGDCIINMPLSGDNIKVVGFENHREHTYMGPELQPLGKVLCGHGNNGRDKKEGFRYKNVFGTNLGALLPRNALLADVILGAALRNKKGEMKFPSLDNTLEDQAMDVMLKRLLPRGKA